MGLNSVSCDLDHFTCQNDQDSKDKLFQFK